MIADLPDSSADAYGGSFRDPAGRVRLHEGRLFREVFEAGRAAFELAHSSGLHRRLIDRGLLVAHADHGPAAWNSAGTWRVLEPWRVPFISYPFEWCVGQLRAAALAVLAIQDEALERGMTLKDAPAENIQFAGGRPVLIDTLSFEAIRQPAWPAYFQFCKSFLAPLAVAVYRDPELLRLLAMEADGWPLTGASRLLPARTWVRPGLAMHLHLHARADLRAARRAAAPAAAEAAGAEAARGAVDTAAAVRRQRALVDSLRRTVEHLRWTPPETEWTRYEAERPTYSDAAWAARDGIVRGCLEQRRPAIVWDLGAALGHASRLAAAAGATTVAFDSDVSCVELMWRAAEGNANGRILPLVQNLLRPTPSLGWAERERFSLSERGPCDLLLALGLLHHLTVRGGVPIDHVLAYVARLGRAALIEFVPPGDPIVAGWNRTFERPPLEEDAFAAAARRAFPAAERLPIPGSARVLYLLTRP